ncbi:YafY family protein [Micromonospora sp. NPDC049559]|uniref:helix-turn-helix transcriptional regulator n=1 Tax=Micromonospora sp. NPDC049559 TaxID=3155923 RepID=UPI00343B42BA
MNRTDRLYALVEELRAVSPRARSARWLAERFTVGERTIRRDVDALQQTGVPIYAEPGRYGGYALDKTHTLPPVNFTPREAIGTAVALHSLAGTPFLEAARSTLRKLVAVMPKRDVERAREIASRVHLRATEPDDPPPPRRPVLAAAEQALLRRTVLVIDYVDQHGIASRRVVEPLGLIGLGQRWYLIGWCRLRAGVREFRLDRITSATATAEIAPPRPIGPGRAGRALGLDPLGELDPGLDAPAPRPAGPVR